MEYLAIFYTSALTGILIFCWQHGRILAIRGAIDGMKEAHAKQVSDLRESNTKLFGQNEELKKIAIDAVRQQQQFLQKPVIDDTNLDQLAQAIAVRLPGNRTH